MKKILLIEDDPFLIEIYKTKLEKEGFEVFVVKSGEEGLEFLKEKVCDLLILDLVLPKMDGWEFLEKIRKEIPEKQFKTIILSNIEEKESKEKAKNFGIEKYLIKAHYTPSEVVKIIKDLLK
jgi:two-component system alkaline phosphatase synthesis response regulator PhoP